FWASAAFTAIFFLGNPFILFDYDTFYAQLTHNIRLDAAFQVGKGPSALEGYAAYAKIFGSWLGYAVLACFLGGLFVEIRRDARRAAVLAILPIGYFLVVGSFGERVPRHMMPAIPPVLLLAAAFLDVLWTNASERLPSRPLRAALATAVVVAVLWTPAAYSFHKLTIIAGPDNRVAARRWIEGNIPEGAKVLVDRNNEYTPLVDPKRYRVGRHDFKGKDEVKSFEDAVEQGYQYVVASSMMYHVNNPLDTTGFYEALERDRRSMALKVFRGEDMTDNFHNPELKIYRIQPDAIVLDEAEPDPDGYFVHDSGKMYLFDVSPRYESDNADAPKASRLMLFEDGRPLGPAHTPVTQIIERGGGRFAHWEGVLYF
ncbi:MAG: hypothetical protein K8I02_01760, partial [Candidatus Methylomirabilis sp.]|nr:hypothetical protein [Deltaproteobacteria bacterium]